MMMPTPTLALKMAVPTAFFGYALIANLALFAAPDVKLPSAEGLMNGKITQEIDGLYRDNLPHKTPAIGLIGAARYLVLNEGRAGVVVGQAGHLFTSEETRPVTPEVYAAALETIQTAANHLKGLEVELVVAPLPAKLDILAAFGGDQKASDAQNALYHQLSGDLKMKQIAVVDTRSALADLEAPFLVTDTHWTPKGARAVAHRIAQSGYVDSGADEYAVEVDKPQSFAGDLVSYVTSDALAPLIGLDGENVTPYRAVAEAEESTGLVDLFGSEEAGVDLVGTSYSANPNWSFAEALKLELARDVVNHAEEGRGPFAPMQTYLDQLDPLALPQTVIWEIPVRYLTDAKLLGVEGTK